MQTASQLRKSLVSAGMTEDDASETVRLGILEGTVEDDENAFGDTTDPGKLAKAVADLHDIAGNDPGEEDDEEDEDEPEEEEILMRSLDAQADETAAVVEAIASGADALLSEVRDQNQRLAKALISLGEEVQSLRTDIAKGFSSVGSLRKGLQRVEERVAEPVGPRAVLTAAEPIPHPGDIAKPAERGEAIQKALAAIQTTNGDQNRAAALSKAVSLLESGAPVADVVNQYRIS